MHIKKDEKIYTVKENELSWTLELLLGGVSVSYNVKKTDCPTFDELKEFVAENSAF